MKKFFAIVTAFSIAFYACCVPASADTGGGTSGNRDQQFTSYTTRYLTDVFEILKKSLQNGELTGEDAVNVGNLTKNYMDNTVNYATDSTINGLRDTLTSISDTLQNAVGGVSDGLREVADGLVLAGRNLLDYCGIDYGKTTATENIVDMKGYGACLYFYNSKSGTDGTRYNNMFIYGEYGKISTFTMSDGTGPFTDYRVYGPGTYDTYFGDSGLPGSFAGSSSFSRSYGLDNRSYPESSGYNYILYGDWRYADGTSADDKTSPSQNTFQTNDPSTLTDTQLIDLLEDLLLNLKLDFPDLSTIEGLLSAILSQCKSINGKIDNFGNSDYSDIQKYIDVAIASLITSNNSNANKIIDELILLRDAFSGDSSGDVNINVDFPGIDFSDITDTDADGVETISEAKIQSALDNLGALLVDPGTGELLGTLSVVDVLALGKGGAKIITSLVGLIVALEKCVPISAISGIMTTMQSIMLNDSPPADLTFSINSEDNYLSSLNGQYVVLSADIFNNDAFKSAQIILKSLLGFFILYTWLKWARSFMADMV